MTAVETLHAHRQSGQEPIEYYPAQSQFRALAQTIRRHWTWGAGIGALLGLATLVLLMSGEKSYPATSVVMITPQREQVVDTAAVLSGLPPESAVVESEIEVIRSRAIAGAVVDTLRLVEDPEFNPDARSGATAPAGSADFQAAIDASSTRVDTDPNREAVISELLDNHLSVRRRGLTYAIEIRVTTNDAEKSAAISNLFARRYLDSQVEAHTSAAQRANAWLSARLTDLRRDLREKEAAVETFRTEHGLMTAAGASLTEQQVAALGTASVQARTDLAEREARLRNVQELIRRGGSADTIAAALDSLVIVELRSQKAEVAREEAELASRLSDRHPALISARQRLSEVDSQIRSEVERIVLNLNNEVEIARARLAAIESSAQGARGDLAGDNDASVVLRELERDAAATRTLLENFLARHGQIEQTGTLRLGDARFVSYATPPSRPSSPVLSLSLITAFAIGMMGFAAAVFAREAMDDVFSSPDDIRKYLGLTTVASVPEVQEVDGRYASGILVDELAHEPGGRGAEAFRQLRSNLLYHTHGGAQVVAIGSALPNEGKTTTAIGLARMSSLSGDNVVLVDCDIRGGDIPHRLQMDVPRGLIDVIRGRCTLDEAIMNDQLTNAHYIPLGANAYEESDIFGTAEAMQVIAELRKRYDLVVLDMPPVVPVSDAQVIGQLADACLMVVRWRKTSREAVQLAMAAFEAAGVRMLGAVLNRVDLKNAARYGCHEAAFKTTYAGFYVGADPGRSATARLGGPVA